MKNGNRTGRLSSEFQKEIYDIIVNKLKNPYITEMFSITGVDVSGDLKHAKVYLSVFSTNIERKTRTFSEIENSAKQIRRELSKVMSTRTVPELHFVLDTAMEYGDKIDKLLKEIAKEDKDN